MPGLGRGRQRVGAVDWSRLSSWWQIKVCLSCHPILCREALDHPFDHPDDPTGPVWIRLDRRGLQREQARSVWSRPDRR